MKLTNEQIQIACAECEGWEASKEATMTRAQTNFHFSDGKISSRVIDLGNANHVRKFLQHATEVIRCHGKVTITASDPASKLVNWKTK